MHFFPSIPAALLTGAFNTPLAIVGSRLIAENTNSRWLQLLWVVVTLFVPLFYSISDRAYTAKRRQEQGFFASLFVPAHGEALRDCYIPTMLRWTAYIASALVAFSLLKVLGVRP
jgi:hypothetical protein